MSNIPIFRAKKINSDEYVEGLLGEKCQSDGTHIKYCMVGNGYALDISTLSIHFPDMLDSQGNKIFASLQEDGKGGDIIKDNGSFVGCVKYENQAICYGDFIKEDFYSWSKLKVIGIQE